MLWWWCWCFRRIHLHNTSSATVIRLRLEQFFFYSFIYLHGFLFECHMQPTIDSALLFCLLALPNCYYSILWLNDNDKNNHIHIHWETLRNLKPFFLYVCSRFCWCIEKIGTLFFCLYPHVVIIYRT